METVCVRLESSSHLCDGAADGHGSVGEHRAGVLVDVSVTGGRRSAQTAENFLQTEQDLTSTLRLKHTHGSLRKQC